MLRFMQDKLSGLWVAAFFELFAFLFWRKEMVVFDAGRQQATWWRRRAFKAANGTVPFSEIKGIGMEASSAEHGTLTYRLTILTSGTPVPMSDVYSGNHEHYESLKTEVLQFLHMDTAEAPNSGIKDENSIQSLLKQGRKVDAIALVRASQHIGLTDAVDVVNRIDEKMKTEK